VIMRLRKLTLRNWRNVALASLDFEGRQQFLLGANGQGKTSLLEAAAFFTALRSFRTLDPRLVIAHGQAEAAIAGVLEHERLGETKVIIKLGAESKEVWCDQERIVRLADDVLGELDPERRGRFGRRWPRNCRSLPRARACRRCGAGPLAGLPRRRRSAHRERRKMNPISEYNLAGLQQLLASWAFRTSHARRLLVNYYGRAGPWTGRGLKLPRCLQDRLQAEGRLWAHRWRPGRWPPTGRSSCC